MFYVKQDPSGTAKRDFILMDEDGNEIDGSGHTGNGWLYNCNDCCIKCKWWIYSSETITGSSSSNTATIKKDLLGHKGLLLLNFQIQKKLQWQVLQLILHKQI